jgi:hypothetical protein
LLIWLNDTYRKSVEISDQLSLRFFSYSGTQSGGAF